MQDLKCSLMWILFSPLHNIPSMMNSVRGCHPFYQCTANMLHLAWCYHQLQLSSMYFCEITLHTYLCICMHILSPLFRKPIFFHWFSGAFHEISATFWLTMWFPFRPIQSQIIVMVIWCQSWCIPFVIILFGCCVCYNVNLTYKLIELITDTPI